MERIQRKILSTVALYHACNDASVVALPAIFPILYTEGVLIRRYSDIGTIILIGLIVAVLFQLVIGHKVKVRHYRRFLAFDTLIVGTSLLLMTLSRNYFMLILFFIGVRLGTSIYHPVGISWISATFRENRLDRAMGLQSAFGDIGVLAAFTSTGFIAEYFGWKIPLFIWGTVNIVALTIGLTVSRGTISKTPTPEEREPVSWRRTIGSLKPFIPPILLGGLAWGVTLNYAPSLLNHKLHISMSRTGIILGCWIGAGALSTLFYGRIAMLLGRTRTIMIAYTIILVAAFTLGVSTSIALTIVAFIIYGMSLFITYPALLSFVGSTIDARNRTAAFSIVANTQIIGNSLFTFISGFLSDAFGIHTPFLLLGSVTLVIVIYLAVIVRKAKIYTGPIPGEVKPKDLVAG